MPASPDVRNVSDGSRLELPAADTRRMVGMTRRTRPLSPIASGSVRTSSPMKQVLQLTLAFLLAFFIVTAIVAVLGIGFFASLASGSKPSPRGVPSR